MSSALFNVVVPGVDPIHRGKVRSVYPANGDLLLVASDRISAYDVVLPTAIPDKGKILTQLTDFWMRELPAARPHHNLGVDPDRFPEPFRSQGDLAGRSMLCRHAEPFPVECIVRGYLSGSGYREYKKSGTLNGEPLPGGLKDGDRLDPIRFTPSTKAEVGHDEAMTWEEFREVVGDRVALELRERSLEIFRSAAPISKQAGMILCDTKFEFGQVDGEIILIDECLSPDASRFWDLAAYKEGKLISFDKQFVRDSLDEAGWDHSPPAPELSAAVVNATRDRYLEAMRRLVGESGIQNAGLSPAGMQG